MSQHPGPKLKACQICRQPAPILALDEASGIYFGRCCAAAMQTAHLFLEQFSPEARLCDPYPARALRKFRL